MLFDFWYLSIYVFIHIIQLQLPPFSPITLSCSTHPIPHIQPSPTLPLSMGPLYMFLDLTHPFFPPLPLYLPLVTVSLFFISMSLVLFCSLVCLQQINFYCVKHLRFGDFCRNSHELHLLAKWLTGTVQMQRIWKYQKCLYQHHSKTMFNNYRFY